MNKTWSRSYYTVSRAFVAHAVPCTQEIQVQRPFPYVCTLQIAFGKVFALLCMAFSCSRAPPFRYSHFRQLYPPPPLPTASPRPHTPTVNRTWSRSYYTVGCAVVAHAVPCAQEIQVQRPFPYVHCRLPLGKFSHFTP